MPDYPFPDLPEPYASALREAVAWIEERYQPLGLIAAGSILRGQGGPGSDLDLYVIHEAAWRQRVQRWFNGVPAEIFVNPPTAVQGYFAEEHHAARPLTAHMLATGHILINRDPVVVWLRDQARDRLTAPPTLTPADHTTMRYMAALQLEDALDVIDADPATGDLIMSQAVHAMLRYACRAAGRFLPRDKDLLAALRALDPELSDLARAYFTAPPSDRRALAEQIADRTVEARGFFEWESDRNPVNPRAADQA